MHLSNIANYAMIQRMNTEKQQSKVVIGATVLVDFGHTSIQEHVAARVDSGARTSSLWASDISIDNGQVSFILLGEGHPDYTGEKITLPLVDIRTVVSSNGISQDRYVVELPIKIAGVSLSSEFTLSDRSKQRYPILVGRNILAGNFLIDCSLPGEAIHEDDRCEHEIEYEGDQS